MSFRILWKLPSSNMPALKLSGHCRFLNKSSKDITKELIRKIIIQIGSNNQIPQSTSRSIDLGK